MLTLLWQMLFSNQIIHIVIYFAVLRSASLSGQSLTYNKDNIHAGTYSSLSKKIATQI